jgi:hypothetical protein
VINIVENAIKYNIAGGRVWVRTGEAAGRAYVQVEITGPPVPAPDTETIFEPCRAPLTPASCQCAIDEAVTAPGEVRGRGVCLVGVSVERPIVSPLWERGVLWPPW